MTKLHPQLCHSNQCCEQMKWISSADEAAFHLQMGPVSPCTTWSVSFCDMDLICWGVLIFVQCNITHVDILIAVVMKSAFCFVFSLDWHRWEYQILHPQWDCQSHFILLQLQLLNGVYQKGALSLLELTQWTHLQECNCGNGGPQCNWTGGISAGVGELRTSSASGPVWVGGWHQMSCTDTIPEAEGEREMFMMHIMHI